MKKYIYILCWMLFYSAFALAQITQEAAQIILHAPITFTQSGVNSFFKDTFNATRYRQEVLPNLTCGGDASWS